MRIVPAGGGLKAKVFLPNSELGSSKMECPSKFLFLRFLPVNMDI